MAFGVVRKNKCTRYNILFNREEAEVKVFTAVVLYTAYVVCEYPPCIWMLWFTNCINMRFMISLGIYLKFV